MPQHKFFWAVFSWWEFCDWKADYYFTNTSSRDTPFKTHLRGSKGKLVKAWEVLLPKGGGGGLAGGEEATELLQKVEVWGGGDRGTPATLLLHSLALLPAEKEIQQGVIANLNAWRSMEKERKGKESRGMKNRGEVIDWKEKRDEMKRGR